VNVGGRRAGSSARRSVDSETAVTASATLSIGALARATGVPVETLRTWERRYGFPQPVRKPSGHRTYPAASVEHLRRVARLLARGHRPAEVLSLEVSELDDLLALSDGSVEPAGERALDTPVATPGALDQVIESMLRAAAAMDRRGLLRELRSQWSRLGPVRFLDEVAGVFLVRVGEAWHDGRLEVRHEHFASAVVADFLREAREPYDAQARGPQVVAATLPGDGHVGGLLMASVLLAVRGRRVVYLGASTPVAQIVEAARAAQAQAVAISVSPSVPRARVTRALVQLRRELPKRTALWVGGAGAPAAGARAERFESLAALDAHLARGV
jgi:DNA-binding transcriptional MerR regulator/methylmalonyl-CoA mutase cobalamin-binding subunit